MMILSIKGYKIFSSNTGFSNCSGSQSSTQDWIGTEELFFEDEKPIVKLKIQETQVCDSKKLITNKSKLVTYQYDWRSNSFISHE